MSKSKLLHNVIAELEKFAPLSFAEKWDNVGLLIEPNTLGPIHRIFLTNDLTERVLEEATGENAVDMIISYHPPIFAPLKRITQRNWKERIVSICLAKSIAVYSPHTAWDSTVGGVNDWLSSALEDKKMKNIRPIQPNSCLPPDSGVGTGRIFNVESSLSQAISSVQNHIGFDVHVALGINHNMTSPIRTAAVCAGSGASLLKGVPADLYVTGEMPHHEILDANHNNVSVILCNHSNSERGFLKQFKNKLNQMLNGDCEIIVSTEDADPLTTYVKS